MEYIMIPFIAARRARATRLASQRTTQKEREFELFGRPLEVFFYFFSRLIIQRKINIGVHCSRVACKVDSIICAITLMPRQIFALDNVHIIVMILWRKLWWEQWNWGARQSFVHFRDYILYTFLYKFYYSSLFLNPLLYSAFGEKKKKKNFQAIIYVDNISGTLWHALFFVRY